MVGYGAIVTAQQVLFREYSKYNDIAMLRMNQIPINGQTIKAAVLPSSTTYTPANRTNVYSQGWGYNNENERSNLLHRAELYTITAEECNVTPEDQGRDRTYQICTFGYDNAQPCGVRNRFKFGVCIIKFSFLREIQAVHWCLLQMKFRSEYFRYTQRHVEAILVYQQRSRVSHET